MGNELKQREKTVSACLEKSWPRCFVRDRPFLSHSHTAFFSRRFLPSTWCLIFNFYGRQGTNDSRVCVNISLRTCFRIFCLFLSQFRRCHYKNNAKGSSGERLIVEHLQIAYLLVSMRQSKNCEQEFVRAHNLLVVYLRKAFHILWFTTMKENSEKVALEFWFPIHFSLWRFDRKRMSLASSL